MKSCNRQILELFYNAKHTGRIVKPDAIARIGEDDEGLVIELTWRVVNGMIVDAKFRAFGNPNAIAITSLMTDNLIGKPVDEAILLGEDVIVSNLGEFRPEYLEVYDIVREAINEAYHNYLKRQSRKEREAIEDEDYTPQTEYTDEQREEYLSKQIQRELSGETRTTTVAQGDKRGRGRPRKEVDPNATIEVGEKRGRGRPRKIVDETLEVEIKEKRGRGRPRKAVDETVQVEIGEKRGRGRPRKEIDPNATVEVGDKRGRGRPRKVVDETAEIVVGEKRGRGRPRKIVDETIEVEVGEKRGRGRPRKEVDPNVIVEVGEKRGRGRPRKEEEIAPAIEVGKLVKAYQDDVHVDSQKPKTEIKFSIPNDLDEVIDDEDVNELINGESAKVDILESLNSSIEQEDDYDIFKSNIRNILSGHEATNNKYNEPVTYEVQQNNMFTYDDSEEDFEDEDYTEDNLQVTSERRGRGRPRKEVDPNAIVEVGEKRGRGRPKKAVEETIEIELSEKRGRGRPRKVVDETLVEIEGEKRGRGRPRKEIDPNIIVEVGEKRGRGRPRKEQIENANENEEVEELNTNASFGLGLGATANTNNTNSNIEIETNQISGTKSNSLNGEVTTYTITTMRHESTEKRERSNEPTNSLTRSLTPSAMPSHNTPEIVFASKNVTTTNINVTKTSNEPEGDGVVRYSYNTNISSVEHKVEVTKPKEAEVKEEIDVNPVEETKEDTSTKEDVVSKAEEQNKSNNYNTFANFEDEDDDFEDYDEQDDEEDIDDSHIKDEAPKGGLEDLLKALLDD